MDAFLRSLESGFIEVRNPFDARSIRRVSLSPADVDCIVFWTRDPRPLLANFNRLGPFRDRFFVHVTVTGYPRSIEPAVLHTGAAVEAVRALASVVGRARIAWRYDPVIVAPGLEADLHRANFARLADALGDSVSRVVVSLLDEYAPTRKRLEAAGFADPRFGSPRHGRHDATAKDEMQPMHTSRAARGLAEPPEPWAGLLRDLAALAKERRLPIQACAEPFDLAPLGIEAVPCIDGDSLAGIFGFSPPPPRDKGQRSLCRCSPSVDIGSYGTCPAACVYCYARR